jgi:hypothetical protein
VDARIKSGHDDLGCIRLEFIDREQGGKYKLNSGEPSLTTQANHAIQIV